MFDEDERGSKYAKRKSKSLAKKFEKGIEMAVNRILDKLTNGENLRDEEIRLLKNYQGFLDGIRSRKREEKVQPLPAGKLKDLLSTEKIKREMGGDLIMTNAKYYQCDYCGYWHKNEDECPYKVKEKSKDESTDNS